MSAPQRGAFRSVKVDDLPWRPSTMASGVFVKDIAITDGWDSLAAIRQVSGLAAARERIGSRVTFVYPAAEGNAEGTLRDWNVEKMGPNRKSRLRGAARESR